jgi:hypothetical protein
MAKAKGSVASKMLTAGSYQYYSVARTGMSLAAGASMLKDHQAASEELLTWYRYQYWCYLEEADSPGVRFLTVACVKKETGDAIPDVTSGDIVEKLRRDGKLFYLRHFVVKKASWPGGVVHFEVEFRNVKLRVGEVLEMMVYNQGANVASDLCDFTVEEYRLVTV